MKASVIVLYLETKVNTREPDGLEHLLSLLDEPGNVDHLHLGLLDKEFGELSDDEIHDVKIALGIIMAAQDLLSFEQLKWFLPDELQKKQDDIRTLLRGLTSIISVPENDDEPIRIVNSSLEEFLLDKERCEDPRFAMELQHSQMAKRCVAQLIRLAEEEDKDEEDDEEEEDNDDDENENDDEDNESRKDKDEDRDDRDDERDRDDDKDKDDDDDEDDEEPDVSAYDYFYPICSQTFLCLG